MLAQDHQAKVVLHIQNGHRNQNHHLIIVENQEDHTEYLFKCVRLSLTLSHQRFKAIQATISPINITVLFTHGINKIFTALNAQDINIIIIIALRGVNPIAKNL